MTWGQNDGLIVGLPVAMFSGDRPDQPIPVLLDAPQASIGSINGTGHSLCEIVDRLFRAARPRIGGVDVLRKGSGELNHRFRLPPLGIHQEGQTCFGTVKSFFDGHKLSVNLQRRRGKDVG